jgi:hypothetical protein
MKSYASMFALTLALAVAITTPARAQTILSTGPIGIVAWTEVPSDCVVFKGAGLKAVTGNGGITFRNNSFGTITLGCYVQSFMRVDPSAVNALGLTFTNINGVVGGVDECLVSTTLGAYPYGGGLPTLIGAFSTAGQNFTTAETANSPLFSFLTVDTDMYAVSIALVRQPGATCNPSVAATFLEDVIQ